MNIPTTEIPDGFEHHLRPSPITAPWEPIYYKRTTEAVVLGLWIAKSHTNSRGLAHGGLMMTLADNAMGLSCGLKRGESDTRLLTASLAIDFIRSAKIGQWLTVETNFIKLGNNLCVAHCFVTADGVTCARANGTFAVLRKKE